MHNFVNIDENFEFFGDVHLNSFHVNNLLLDGEMKGDPDTLINGFRLPDLVDSYFSINKPQNFTNPIHIPRVVIRGNISADYLNGYDFKEIVHILKNMKTNEQMLYDSNVVVDQMFVNGSIWFSNVNGYDFEYVKANAIRLDRTNNIDFPITFLDPVYVNGNLNIEQFNGENFNEFVNDLVRKSANVTRVYGTTVFNEDVTVSNNAEVTTINDMQVNNILTKNFNGQILDSVRIVGDVTIPNVIIEGKLDDVSADDINSYSYDDQSGSFVLHKDVFFNQSVDINYLEIHGGYDDIGNVDEHLKDLIRIDRPALITGTKTFTNSVHFESDIYIFDYNGIDVPHFLDNVILIDQLEPADIYSDVVFAAPVIIPQMKIIGDLTTSTINDCSVTDWVQNTIRIDQPFNYDGALIFPDGTFKAANIITKYINEYPVDDILTLNTPQTFVKPVHFNNVYSTVPIVSSGLVSGYDFQRERQNTLMVSA